MKLQYADSSEPTTKEAVQDAETVLGAEFPADFKSFLLTVNGGRPGRTAFRIKWNGQPWSEFFESSSVSYFYGLTDDEDDLDILREFDGWKERIPADTIPIGNDPGGSLILMILKGDHRGEIHYWVQDYEVDFEGGETPDFRNVGFVAGSFSELLSNLTASE